MTEQDTAAPTDEGTPVEDPQDARPVGADEGPVDFEAKYKETLAEARKWEQRAKDNNKAKGELERQRRESLTEAERAVADAEERGRKGALAEVGQRLAQARFDAAAAKRNPDVDTSKVLEFVDLGRFVGDDGAPDEDAIKAAVERLVPEPAKAPTDYDGGPRGAASFGADFNKNIRQAAGRA